MLLRRLARNSYDDAECQSRRRLLVLCLASVSQLESGSKRAVLLRSAEPRERRCMHLLRFIDSQRIHIAAVVASSVTPHAASYDCEKGLSEPYLQL